MNIKKIFKSYWPLLIILVVSAFLFTLRLDRDLLTDWDECVYAQQALEMKQTGNFLTNQWNRALVFEKPPLYNWLIQVPYFFKVNEFSARLPMVILSLLLITFVYLFAKKHFSQRTAIFTSLLLLSSQLIVTYSVRVNTDIGFTLFIFLGFYYWIEAQKKEQLSYVSGIFFGLAVLTKGLGVIPYLFAIAITVLFNFNKKSIHNYIKMIGSFLVIMLPWHIYHLVKYGNAFFQVYIIEHIIKRSNIAIDFHFEGRLFYIKLLFKQLFPWILFIAVVPFFWILDLRKTLQIKNVLKYIKENHLIFSLFIIFLVVLISITKVKTRIAWYAMPLFPFLVLIIAYSLDSVLNRIKLSFVQYLVFALLILNSLYTIKNEVRIFDSKRIIDTRNDIFLQSQKQKDISINYLVWYSERRAEETLSPTMRTSTTFTYGGNPCAVYYSKKKINYYYSTDKFVNRVKKGNGLFVIEKGDLHFIKDIPIKKIYENRDYLLFRM